MNPASPYRVFLAAVLTLVAALTLAIPLYVIRPFVPQSPLALATALAVRNWSPLISGACLLLVALLAIATWKSSRTGARIGFVVAILLTLAVSVGTHINIFEKMFHPYPAPVFASAAEAPIAPTDKLLSITIAGQTHAFPIRTLGYHHIVNDTLAGQPIAATYCTLCHTGIVWSRLLEGRTLSFTLAGINNGNALLRDRETGSIWQQSTGQAIFGPLKDRQLTLLPSDELTFALWQKERPAGQILAPDAPDAAEYDPADWETHIAQTHVVLDTSATGIEPHTIMLGINRDATAKAFPLQTVLADGLIQDRLAGQPLLLVVGPDQASIRAFTPTLPGQTLSFVLTSPGAMTDRQTASTWNFQGCATAGPLTGKCLPPVESHKDYWFDWHNHHPNTLVFHG